MAKPTLPQHDRRPERRAHRLAEQRRVWRLDKSYHGLVFIDPDSVQRAQELRWLGRSWRRYSWGRGMDAIVGIGLKEVFVILWHKMQTAWNSIRTRWVHAYDGPDERIVTRITRICRRFRARRTAHIWSPGVEDRTPRPWTERQPLTEEQLRQTLPTLPPPASFDRWQEDEFFAWERLAGQVPIMIEWIQPGELDRIRTKLPISSERYADARPGDTLEAAEADGRLFVVDYAMLDGIETGVSFGWRKWMTAPIGIFVLTTDRRRLLPIAIQCGQDPAETSYFTPADGEDWRSAKIHFQVSESNYHGVVEHGTLCHMLVGAIGLSARRHLAPNHPLRVLLEPHLERTMGVNIATRSLFAPGGLTTELQSVSLAGTVQLSRWGWNTFDWGERSSEQEFARRGVLDPKVLPEYPFRDDSQLVTKAIRQFVSDYVDVYYDDDADVEGDHELCAWFDELQAVEGPDAVEMPSIETPTTRNALSAFLTDLLWRISPFHAVINYRVYESMGFVPFTPTAAYAPPPPEDPKKYGPDHWLWIMPPQEGVDAQVEDTWNVANTRMNHLGQYGCHFRDRRVKPLIDRFRTDLDRVEDDIEGTNLDRFVAFDTLLPSNLTNSIHV